MFLRWIGAVTLLVVLHAQAVPSLEPLDKIAGTWLAADGSAKMEFSWGLDQRIMLTRMYFKDLDQWKLVSEGSYVCDTINDEVRGMVVGIDMGVDFFSILLNPESGKDQLIFDNHAHMDDGSISISRERWLFPDPSTIKYQVFRFEENKEVPWFGGEWNKQDESSP